MLTGLQTETSTGNQHHSSTTATFTVTVPSGRTPINGQYQLTSGAGEGVLVSSYRSAANAWTFKFAKNSSGVTQTYTLSVDHVESVTLDTVEVLRAP